MQSTTVNCKCHNYHQVTDMTSQTQVEFVDCHHDTDIKNKRKTYTLHSCVAGAIQQNTGIHATIAKNGYRTCNRYTRDYVTLPTYLTAQTQHLITAPQNLHNDQLLYDLKASS